MAFTLSQIQIQDLGVRKKTVTRLIITITLSSNVIGTSAALYILITMYSCNCTVGLDSGL